MKRILIIAGSVFALLLVAIAALPFFVPSSVYKAQIEKAASNALGRPVTVQGEARISVFPVISASVEDVRVSNPDGFDEPDMITAGALRGSVKLIPLFSRNVEIGELAFEDATVRLTRLENGDVNWQLGNPGSEPSDPAEPSGKSDPFSASINRARLSNASLIYDDQQAGTRYELSEFNAEASLKSSERPLSFRANGKFQQESFELDLTMSTPATLMAGAETVFDARFGSDLGNLTFDGSLSGGDTPTLNGDFSTNLPQIASIAEFLDLSLPLNTAPLGGLRASGSVRGPMDALVVTFQELALSGDGMTANYDGAITLGVDPAFDGNAKLAIRDVYALTEALGIPVQQLQPVKQVSVDTQIAGPVSGLNFANINARTSSPTLTSSFTGDVSLKGDGAINGKLSAKSDQLRQLITQTGTTLPEGDQLKSFSIEGDASGSFLTPTLRNGTYALDDTRAAGTLSADLSGPSPSVKADVTSPRLDLTPFMGESSAQSSASSNQGWSDERLDLAAMKLLNADLRIVADEIIIGDIALSDADLGATLKNGRLVADLARFTSFGGTWQGRAIVDASASTPTFDFNMAAQTIQAQSLLSTLAGFDRLSGNGQFAVDVSSTGVTINQIVDALDGTLSLDLDSGALAGINLGQLVRTAGSLSGALSSGNLSLQSLGDVVSPQAETDFTDFSAQLELQNGLAQIQTLKLANSVLDVSGAGQINLGGRTMDVKLTPAVDRAGQGEAATVQLNGIPVPIRVQGSWTSPKFTPDFSGVQAALTASARDRIAGEAQQRLGGDLGAIASGIISGRQPTESSAEQAPAESDEDAAVGENEASELEEEDEGEKLIRDAIGSIFRPD